MNNVLFITSHIHSGSSGLIEIMNQNPRVEIRDTDIGYDHPDKLKSLFQHGHKLDNTAAIYGEHLLFNMHFTSSVFYDFCKFIYIIRDAKSTIEEIMSDKKRNYSLNNAIRYYCYRLRRMCEMAKKTPGAILLRWQDLSTREGLELVEDYLNLKQPLEERLFSSPEITLASELTDKSQDVFERHLYYLNNLDLRKVE